MVHTPLELEAGPHGLPAASAQEPSAAGILHDTSPKPQAQNGGEAVAAKLLGWFRWIRANDAVFERVFGEMDQAVCCPLFGTLNPRQARWRAALARALDLNPKP